VGAIRELRDFAARKRMNSIKQKKLTDYANLTNET
jgi:hypothetical protein